MQIVLLRLIEKGRGELHNNFAGNGKMSSSTSSRKISLRSVRMGSLTNEILNVLGDEKEIRIILEENRDFLLEPLEEEDTAVVRQLIDNSNQ